MNGILALDCGGSGTHAVLISWDGVEILRVSGPAANFYTQGMLGVATALSSLQSRVLRTGHVVDAVAIAMAGLRTEGDRARLIESLRGLGVQSPLFVCSDSEAALRAGGWHAGVVLVCGTGSSAYARDHHGHEARAGGWGGVLGDEGSGFWLGRNLLTHLTRSLDNGTGEGERILPVVLQSLGLTNAEDLCALARSPVAATQIAGLVPLIARLRADGELVASTLVNQAVLELARLARLAGDAIEVPTPRPVLLAGGVSTGIGDLPALLQDALGRHYAVKQLDRSPAWGAYWLAHERDNWTASSSTTLSLTELRNPLTADIDQIDTLSMLCRINEADAQVPGAVQSCLPELSRLVDITVDRLNRGGRLIYVGAGTSGRLAMLDAVECIPTFGVEPGVVSALVAGGEEALARAAEGAEDDSDAGRNAIRNAGVGPLDVVVGVSASGTARYVIAALETAVTLGAATCIVTCNPMAHVDGVGVEVTAPVGPEVIAGSTRMKAGTAQKLILNMLSTAVMIRLGKTRGNLMTSVRPTNSKLRARATRLVMKLGPASEESACAALEACEWKVEAAIAAIRGQ